MGSNSSKSKQFHAVKSALYSLEPSTASPPQIASLFQVDLHKGLTYERVLELKPIFRWNISREMKMAFEDVEQHVKGGNATVVRQGAKERVSVMDLVPGDLVELCAGEQVPADVRLTKISDDFTVNEANLTGEDIGTKKSIEALEQKSEDQISKNMVLMLCKVESGEGQGVVVRTGKDTFVFS